MAQAVSRLPPNAQAVVQFVVSLLGFVLDRVTLGGVFLLSVLLHHCFTSSMLILLLTEGRAGGNWELLNKVIVSWLSAGIRQKYTLTLFQLTKG